MSKSARTSSPPKHVPPSGDPVESSVPHASAASLASSLAPAILHADPQCSASVPPPCAKAELNDLDPAESYACQCLKESNFSRAAVAHLFSILDKDPPPAKFDAPNAQSFSAGCFTPREVLLAFAAHAESIL